MKKKYFISLCALLFISIVSAAEQTLYLPFDRPDEEVLRKMEKKVFAHYFSAYPISIDNRNPDVDYYAKGYIDINGEKGKHVSYGGWMRERPMPRYPREDANWKSLDRLEEVKMAANMGIDGFTYDMLGITGRHWDILLDLMEQVNRYGKGFKILLMPDMMAAYRKNPEELVPSIMKIANDPSLYHLEDGRLLIAPYNAQMQTPAYWAKVIADFEAQGVKVALLPTFQGWWKYLPSYKDVSWGFSDWGCSVVHEQETNRTKALQTNERYNKPFMAPIRPQDYRPKSGISGDAHGSALARAMWKTAIEEGAQYAQLITWSDYSESSEIMPSTSTRWGYYDLMTYYTTYFKTGKAPEIVRDAIYCFYRPHALDAKPKSPSVTKTMKFRGNKYYEDIELLGFLKAPATLKIEIAGKVFEKEYPAGVHSFTIPLIEGQPRFSVVRNNKEVVAYDGPVKISNDIEVTNFLYHADGGTAEEPRKYTGPQKMVSPLVLGEKIKDINEVPNVLFGAGGAGKSYAQKLSEKLADNTEIIFYVDSLEKTGTSWVAFFLSAASEDGKTKYQITPRTAVQTYISGNIPAFKVVKGNFTVEYPVVYRIRRTDGKLQFLYKNSVVFEVEENSVPLDCLSLHVGAGDANSSGKMVVSKVELRKLPK